MELPEVITQKRDFPQYFVVLGFSLKDWVPMQAFSKMGLDENGKAVFHAVDDNMDEEDFTS